MRVHDGLLRCIAFLGLPGSGDRNDASYVEGARWGGTGFFVFVPTPTRKSYVSYLVTAKHSVEELQGREFILRTYSPSGSSHGIVPANSKWWFHPETPDTVDVAVLPCKPPFEALDLRLLMADEWFITDEIIRERDIGPGDEVFMTGLFSLMSGPGMNSPIVRTGNIAMMPKHNVPRVKVGRETYADVEAYLIEVRSTGGLSGSPVFVRETTFFDTKESKTGKPLRIYGRGHPFLLGLVNGHWSIKPEDRNNPSIVPFTADPLRINLGIAVVIPARKIMEVLNHPELAELRGKPTVSRQEACLPMDTEDSATSLES